MAVERKFNPEDPEFVAWYAGLFRNARRNHKRICELLRKQVQGRARFVRFPASYRSDIMQDATIKAMQEISSFDPTRGDPIAFFNKVIDNCMLKEIQKVQGRSRMTAVLEPGLEPATIERPDGLAAARVKARLGRARPLSACPEIHRILKLRIKNAVESFNMADARARRDIKIILATLQDVRREVSGKFIPIRVEGIQYSEERRLHELGAA